MSAAGPQPGLQLDVVALDQPAGANVIIGQAHFIKAVDDLHGALAGAGPHLRFGVAFCEASGPRLIRRSGNDEPLVRAAVDAAARIGAGHSFVAFLLGGYPLSVLNQVKAVPEVCRVFAATANPVQVLVGRTALGGAILGVVDGYPPAGVEDAAGVAERERLLRDLGYKA